MTESGREFGGLGIRMAVGLCILTCLALVVFVTVVPGRLERDVNATVLVGPHAANGTGPGRYSELRVVDFHSDSLLWDRDLSRRADYGHVDLPRLLEAGMTLQVFSAVTQVPKGASSYATGLDIADGDVITSLVLAQTWPPRTWFSPLQRALYQANRLHRVAADSDGTLLLVRSRGELRELLRRRANGERLVGAMLSLEGAQVLEGQLGNLPALFEAGYRALGLSHLFDNEFAGSRHGLSGHGLSRDGRQLIRQMQSLGMLVDLAHASAATIQEVLELAEGPVISSHGGVRGTCDNPRNLSDESLRSIAASGGFVAIGFWETAVCGETLEAIVAAIRHAVTVAGVDHVALGSDFDGAVRTVFDVTGMPLLADALAKAGFTGEAIRKVMGDNALRVLDQVLPQG